MRRVPAAARAVLLGPALAAGLVGAGPAAAQVEVLSPQVVARLDPAKERPLALTPGGDVARLAEGDGAWQDGGSAQILDLDRDGTRDFVVLSFVDPGQLRQAVVIHEWGEAPDRFGPAVFYLVLDGSGDVVEWGGRHRLEPRKGSP